MGAGRHRYCSPAEACQFLIDLANLRGGPDNITALVVHVTSGGGGQGPYRRAAEPRGDSPAALKWLNTLAAGVSLAAVATAMEVNQWWGGRFVFVLASAAILAGLAGLGLYYRQERRKQTEEEERTGVRARKSIDGRRVASKRSSWTVWRGRWRF